MGGGECRESPCANLRGSKKRTLAQRRLQNRWRAVAVPRKRYASDTASPSGGADEPTSTTATTGMTDEQYSSDDGTSPVPDPRTILSAARTDPFANYTIPQYAHEAMDHGKCSIIRCASDPRESTFSPRRVPQR